LELPPKLPQKSSNLFRPFATSNLLGYTSGTTTPVRVRTMPQHLLRLCFMMQRSPQQHHEAYFA